MTNGFNQHCVHNRHQQIWLLFVCKTIHMLGGRPILHLIEKKSIFKHDHGLDRALASRTQNHACVHGLV